jgi:steroid delta-isomerase-like uncharacterized protein
MATQDNAALARTFYDSYNNHDFDQAITLCDEDLQWVNLSTGETFRGPEGCRRFLEGWANGFPESRVEIQNLHPGEDFVVCEGMFRGTHTGPLVGPAGEIQATGRSVEIPFCQVHEIKDDKFVSCRLYFDAATLLSQLGVLPTPQQA